MLTIEHLTKSYGGDVKAVDDLSLTVLPGDIYGFIGHNGAGKTTTLRAVAGILSYDSGVIRVNGRNIAEEPIACAASHTFFHDASRRLGVPLESIEAAAAHSSTVGSRHPARPVSPPSPIRDRPSSAPNWPSCRPA